MIYLDYAAATPVSDKAIKAMLPYLNEDFFNPSAAYLPAVNVRRAYEKAKDDIAHVIGAKGADLVMTSGATESTNLAFSLLAGQEDAEVLISAVEHPSVIENAKRVGNYQTIKVDGNGRVDSSTMKLPMKPLAPVIRILFIIKKSRFSLAKVQNNSLLLSYLQQKQLKSYGNK